MTQHLRQAAEWIRHDTVWTAWPSHGELWRDALPDAQREFTGLCRAIADLDGKGQPRGESLSILVPDGEAKADATKALAGLPVRFFEIPFGDIWLRDTAPIFVQDSSRQAAACFRFNGWGGKYVLPHDAEVAGAVAQASGRPRSEHRFVLEGGSVEVDGEGTVLTTRQCLLNDNRNPGMSQADLEGALRQSLGAETVLWLDEGLLNDHTDGHIDTLARFIAPGVVMCMAPSGKDDPNAAVLERIAKDLRSMHDARGRRLEVVTVPSPGLVREADNDDGRVMPASHVNFYIANTTVVVPVYGTNYDDAAVQAIGKSFPGRRTVGVSARAILEGGGAFHCITQQQPSVGGPLF